MKNQKGSAVVWIIIIIALVVILGGIYFYLQPKQSAITSVQNQVATSTIATPTNMPGWQTYTNSQYGFSFQYPTSWGAPMMSKNNDEIFFGQNGNANVVVNVPVTKTLPNGQSETFEQAMASVYNANSYSKTQFAVGGIQSLGVSSPQVGDSVYVPLPNNQILEIDGDFNNPEFIGKSIFSTFKFISTATSTDTIGKKKRKLQGGFSFQYPATYQVGSPESNFETLPGSKNIVEHYDPSSDNILITIYATSTLDFGDAESGPETIYFDNTSGGCITWNFLVLQVA